MCPRALVGKEKQELKANEAGVQGEAGSGMAVQPSTGEMKAPCTLRSRLSSRSRYHFAP